MDKSQAERELLSVIIAESLRDEIVTVGALADRAARHGFGLLMIVLSLPAMFPVLPPGLPALVGLLHKPFDNAKARQGLQMLIGLERPWLPGGVRRYTLSARAKQILQQRGIPFLRRVEKFARPRQLWIPDAISTRVVAVALFLLGVVLFSPLPFFHTIPALTVMILGFGLVNRDGFLLVGGLALSAGVVAGGVIGAEKLIALLEWFFHRL